MPTKAIAIATKNRHSEEINKILSATPAWMLSYGITVWLCLLIMPLVLSAFINYPTKVTSRITFEASVYSKLAFKKRDVYFAEMNVSAASLVKIRAGQQLIWENLQQPEQKHLLNKAKISAFQKISSSKDSILLNVELIPQEINSQIKPSLHKSVTESATILVENQTILAKLFDEVKLLFHIQ